MVVFAIKHTFVIAINMNEMFNQLLLEAKLQQTKTNGRSGSKVLSRNSKRKTINIKINDTGANENAKQVNRKPTEKGPLNCYTFLYHCNTL